MDAWKKQYDELNDIPSGMEDFYRHKAIQHSLPEAQAEIARLQAEVERLKDYGIAAVSEAYDRGCKSAWNDAIEAAAMLADLGVSDGGMARSMAFFLEVEEWSEYRRIIKSYADSIRALKRPT